LTSVRLSRLITLPFGAKTDATSTTPAIVRSLETLPSLDGLQLGDLSDRADRDAAELAHPFGELVGGGEDRFRLLVQHQMIVVEMPAADMPVEVLGLQVKRKGVRQQRVEGCRNLLDGGRRQVGRRIKFGGYLVGFVVGFAHVAPSC
jgi:hypothetical protein